MGDACNDSACDPIVTLLTMSVIGNRFRRRDVERSPAQPEHFFATEQLLPLENLVYYRCILCA